MITESLPLNDPFNHHGESSNLDYSGAQGKRGEDDAQDESWWHGNNQKKRLREKEQK